VLAAAGILLLGEGIGEGTDPWGIALALLAGTFWAAYILLSARVGRRVRRRRRLALALIVGAVAVAPLGVVQGGTNLLDPTVLRSAS
jgi:inner membrane transporter RhtA